METNKRSGHLVMHDCKEYYKKRLLVIVCLSAIFISCAERLSSTKEGDARSHIMRLERFLEEYRKDMGDYPNANNGLKALFQNDKGDAQWRGPYMPKGSQSIIDPWKNIYVYNYPAVYGGKPFDLYSKGPNGIDDSGREDDISNWMRSISRKRIIKPLYFLAVVCLLAILFLKNKLKKESREEKRVSGRDN